jgi:hypothetical protein
MSEETKTAEPLPTPEVLATEPGVTEVLRIWTTSEGKVYGSWDDSLAGGTGGLGGLLGSVAQMIVVQAGDERTASERLRTIVRDFVASAARVPAEAPEWLPQIFEYNQIVGAFHEETDRAAGILGAAWLDSYLGQCLRYFLVHDEQENPQLVGTENMADRPLSSFKVRAQALYLLGLLTKDALRDVTFIVKIRNQFAHHPGTLTFDDQKVKNWCAELRSTKKGMGNCARECYLFAISWLVIELNNTVLLTHPRDEMV